MKICPIAKSCQSQFKIMPNPLKMGEISPNLIPVFKNISSENDSVSFKTDIWLNQSPKSYINE